MKTNVDTKTVAMDIGGDGGNNKFDSAGYNRLLQLISEAVQDYMETDNPIYYVIPDQNRMSIFDIFIDSLPDDPEIRQHYNCNKCRHILNKYGRLVTINESFDVMPIMFNYSDEVINGMPAIFQNFLRRARYANHNCEFGPAFIPSEKRWFGGYDGMFNHFGLNVSRFFANRDYLYGITSGTIDQNLSVLRTTFTQFDLSTIQTAIDVLNTIGQSTSGIQSVYNMKVVYDNVDEKMKDIILHYYAYTGKMVSFKNSSIGALINKIQNGIPIDKIVEFYKEITNGINYKRPKSDVSISAIQGFDKVVTEYGGQDAFRRRYACIDDIPEEYIIWKDPSLMHFGRIKNSPKLENLGNIFEDKIKQTETPKYSDNTWPNNKSIISDTANTFSAFMKKLMSTKNAHLCIDIKNVYNYAPVAFLTAPMVKGENLKPIFKDPYQISMFTYYQLKQWSYYGCSSRYLNVIAIIKFPDVKGYLLILDRLNNIANNVAAGLFPDKLVDDLYKYRRVIEGLSNRMRVEVGDSVYGSGCMMVNNNAIDFTNLPSIIVDDGKEFYSRYTIAAMGDID